MQFNAPAIGAQPLNQSQVSASLQSRLEGEITPLLHILFHLLQEQSTCGDQVRFRGEGRAASCKEVRIHER